MGISVKHLWRASLKSIFEEHQLQFAQSLIVVAIRNYCLPRGRCEQLFALLDVCSREHRAVRNYHLELRIIHYRPALQFGREPLDALMIRNRSSDSDEPFATSIIEISSVFEPSVFSTRRICSKHIWTKYLVYLVPSALVPSALEPNRATGRKLVEELDEEREIYLRLDFVFFSLHFE